MSARWLAERLAPRLRQPVIVENKVGAAGNIGSAMAAHSSPDGYTLLVIHQGTMTINPHLYPRLGYDPLADLVPITQLGIGPLVLAVTPTLPVTSLGDLIRYAQERPGQLSYGSAGTGTPPHVASELFKRAAGIDVVHIPYRGGSQVLSDVVAGHLAFAFQGLGIQLPQIQAGRLRPLAVTGPHRMRLLPDVPTFGEAGLPDFEFLSWTGIAAPSGTPAPIIARLYQETAAILATHESREWFAASGDEPGGMPPQAFAAAIRAEHARWKKLIRDANIRIEQ